jgi:formylglycine-generating enzyme required for sulfatase activity
LYAALKLSEALQYVQDALAIHPTDSPALALKVKIKKAVSVTLALGNGMTMKLVRIEAGKFMMGFPTKSRRDPQHQVTISKPFYMGVTEVTQAQWKAVMNTQPWQGKKRARSGNSHAASYISWKDATAFCTAVSEKTKRTVRLPTEAEWEYACRAGTTTAYSFGDDVPFRLRGSASRYNPRSKMGGYAWYEGNAQKYAHRVGVKKPSVWGLYDMHGNVYEWTADWYGPYANSKARDPKGQATGWGRVIRGGSWLSVPSSCRSASRDAYSPDTLSGAFGFRVVAGEPPSAAAVAEAPEVALARRNAEVARKLNTRISKLEFNDMELSQVFQFIRDVSSVSIHVRWRALALESIEPKKTVNLRLSNVNFRKALESILEDVAAGGKSGLGYVISEGVIIISTKSDLGKPNVRVNSATKK